MKTLSELLMNPVADALGWTLLHALWQGFALVLPTAVVLYLLRHRSSAGRYAVGVSVLLIQLLVSVVTFCWYYEPIQLMPSIAAPAMAQALPVRWLVLTQPSPWHQQVRFFLESHLSQFVFVYLIGVTVFALRLVGGWVYLQRLSQTAVQPAAATLTELTARLRVVLAIRAVVQVRESARIAVPMVVGILKPVLLLPIGLITQLTPHQIEAVLAHELAHVKRHDYAVNLLQSVMEVLYFFHPALWWLSARVREEREHCCDDLAVRACGGDGRTLAQALARVEELRLMQIAPTPALAMAFATRRQQLLYRVRRMLGVPTRPIVSNGSLAGLTLATLLLISASVFAVQQRQDKPKPRIRTAQPQPTRRHTIDSRSEYGMAGNQRISYVVWKGQRLPASRVAKLQRQLDQVMAGHLNLDNVKQPDRDILLTIIEKNVLFDAGMKALSEGMAQINYGNIEVSARASVPVNATNSAVENDAQLSATDTIQPRVIQQRLDSLTRQMSTIIEQRQPSMDRLTKEMTDLSAKNGPYQQKLTPLINQIGQLASQQGRMAQKLVPLNIEISRLSTRNDTKSKALLQQKEGESRRLEAQMEKLSTQIDKLTTQIDPLTAQLEPYQNRMEALADSINSLSEPLSAVSEQIGMLSEQIAESAQRQAEEAMRQAENAMRAIGATNAVPVRPARAPRPPKAPAYRPARPPQPPKAASAISPAAPPTSAVAPKPARPALAPKPTPVAKPVSAPKAAPVPKLQGKAENNGAQYIEPNQSPTQLKYSLAELGRLVDQDTALSQASFHFKPDSRRSLNIRSVTFTKHDDQPTLKGQKTGKANVTLDVGGLPQPK